MPKKKDQQPKPPHDMTSEELARKVFPPKVLEELKKIANPDSSQDKSK